MGCESGIRLSWGLVGSLRERERRIRKKHVLAGYKRYTVYVHYFKDIRQVALQSYCV